MESLTNIFNNYNTDKNSRCHNYSRQYDDLLKKYRDKDITLLEIGVFEGESLKAWRSTFQSAKKIVGVDITPSCKKFESNGIFVEIGDATNTEFIDYLQKTHGPFDIIVDDGSHVNKDIIQSFEKLFPLLNDNGIYIVEDTVTYNHDYYKDLNYPNHLEYFTKFFPYLNQTMSNWCVDPFKIQKKTENVFEYSIDSILYGVSFIAIHKKIRNHWIP